MKERKSLSIFLLFPARALQFNINIIRKRKGRTVNSNLETSVYTSITCSALIKEILIHNTMEMETYILKVLVLCIAKTMLCSDGKHNTKGKRLFFPWELRLHKKSSSVHPQRFSKTQWQEGQPKYLARLLPGPTHELCKATLCTSLKEHQGMQQQAETLNKNSQVKHSAAFMLEKLSWM